MASTLMPVTRALLVSCVGVFVVQKLGGDALLTQYFALWPIGNGLYAPPLHWWQLVSYAFLHGSFTHLAFNMFALYLFGSEIERLLGTQRYLTYYFTCVVGAALAQLTIGYLAHWYPVATVGASGGIFGLLLAFGMAYPQRRLMLLFPPIPMKAWLFVTLYGLLELVLGVTGTSAGVAHFAHLGGMAAGFLLIVYWRRQRA
jgi:membrane associated rhomboid family serine protease